MGDRLLARRPRATRAATSRTPTSSSCTGASCATPRWRSRGTGTGGGPRASGSTAASSPAIAGEARALAASRAGGGGIWGWKDPRTTLLLDFWDEILEERAFYVLLYRLPWEVADSMQRLGADVFLRHPEWAYPHLDLLQPPSAGFPPPPPGALAAGERQRPAAGPGAAARPCCGRSSASAVAGESLEAAARPRTSSSPWSRGDPLISLVAATSPRCAEVLAGARRRRRTSPARTCWSAPPLRRGALAAGRPGRPLGGDPLLRPRRAPGRGAGERRAERPGALRADRRQRRLAAAAHPARSSRVLRQRRLPGHRPAERRPLRGAQPGDPGGARGGTSSPWTPTTGCVPAGFAASAPPARRRARGGGGLRRPRSTSACAPAASSHAGLRPRLPAVDQHHRRLRRLPAGGLGELRRLRPGDAAWEDWELWIAALERGWRFRHLPEVAFEYRVRPGSMLDTRRAGGAALAPALRARLPQAPGLLRGARRPACLAAKEQVASSPPTSTACGTRATVSSARPASSPRTPRPCGSRATASSATSTSWPPRSSPSGRPCGPLCGLSSRSSDDLPAGDRVHGGDARLAAAGGPGAPQAPAPRPGMTEDIDLRLFSG